VQAAREAARRTQCINNLKQLGLGCINHEAAHGHFPAGGWGWDWVGDADRGFSIEQPGGWVYNILPYIEEGAFHANAGDGDPATITQRQRDGATRVIANPITIVNCPTRRESRSYVHLRGGFMAFNASNGDLAGRTDYAINCGSQQSNEVNAGPPSLDAAASFSFADPRAYSGVCFVRSALPLRKISDGTSKTYLVGEKYLNPTNYSTGLDPADNETWCTGFNNDNFRNAFTIPRRDTPNFQDTLAFGSPHTSQVYFVFCDNSVRGISFDIDLLTHQRLASRGDGQVTNATP
jgi:hypothetical protein